MSRGWQAADRVLLGVTVVAALVAAGLVLRKTTLSTRSTTIDSATDALAAITTPSMDGGAEDQIHVVFVVSSTCASCQSLVGDPIVEDIVQAVAHHAEQSGAELRVVGVAIDEPWQRGAEFLESIGPFHEVLSGGAWLNTGVVLYGHRDLPGPLGVPQVVVVRRNISRVGDQTVVDADQLLARKVGLNELWRWQERGFPIRRGTLSQAASASGR